MNLSQLYRRTFNKPLRVYWWRYDPPNRLNFGDEITPLIIKELVGKKCVWASPKECDIAGAGSIIEILQNESSGNGIKIWGSGFIKAGSVNKNSNLEFYAVRGYKSLERTKHRSLPVGDPGLLLPLIYEKAVPKKYAIGLVSHYVDWDSEFTQTFIAKHANSILINPLWEPERVINAIRACECIISSSLHGLIVADAFGIPNRRVIISDMITGGNYKYEDYYSVFKKDSPEPFKVSAAMNISPNEVIENYTTLPSIRRLQEGLLRSFPANN